MYWGCGDGVARQFFSKPRVAVRDLRLSLLQKPKLVANRRRMRRSWEGGGPALIVWFAASLRVGLIIFGGWQDAHMEVPHSDYTVFSDAARLMVQGKSPFERDHHRYSPLLALLLVPNIVLHRCWGKVLFAAAGG